MGANQENCLEITADSADDVVTSQDLDEDVITSPDSGDAQDEEIISASDSSFENDSQDGVLSSAYLILDNDADKENINIGDEVTWIISVINLGPDTALNTKVYDQLPDGLKYIKHFATKGLFNPKTGIWNIGDLSVDEGPAILLITTKALTSGEKINKANLTSDTVNDNNVTYEEEEIDVLENDHDDDNDLDKSTIKMYETGNPLFLLLIALLAVPIFKRY